jgi:leucyl/phenylalanyl-tRNA--protein transferase
VSAITPHILLKAYAAGVFPMAESAEDPSLYWVEPEERGIIPLDGLIVSRSLCKAVRQQRFDIRIDTAFSEVMRLCAERTNERKETWINARILRLYGELYSMGHCHSVESWQDGKLVGGLYGLSIGSAFFGESMFSRATDASKVALVHLVARLNAGGFTLLDAQFMNSHLETLGAIPIMKIAYLEKLRAATQAEADFNRFKNDGDAEAVLQLARAP